MGSEGAGGGGGCLTSAGRHVSPRVLPKEKQVRTPASPRPEFTRPRRELSGM